MDMWDPYVASTREHLDESEKKIVYDKYHIAAYLAKAVDQVRRAENKRLRALGDERLAGTKHTWLRHPASFSEDAWREFRALRESNVEDGAGVGVEGPLDGDAAVRLSSRVGGASFLRAMARLGLSQPADADGRCGAAVDGAPRKHTHVSETPHYERGQRGVELKDSMGQGHGARFPQSTELHQRHLLPLWETRSGSFAHLKRAVSMHLSRLVSGLWRTIFGGVSRALRLQVDKQTAAVPSGIGYDRCPEVSPSRCW